jgi:hypothetical protein
MSEMAGILNTASQAAPLVALAGGIGSDIYGATQRAAALDQQRKAYAQQRAISDVTTSPDQLGAFIQKLYQPMSGAQTDAVGRDLNANLAMRGVQQGGYANQFVADAMAKLENDRYNAAAQTALSSLQGSPRLPLLTQGVLMPPGAGGATGAALNTWAQLAALRRQQQLSGGLSALPGGTLPPGSIPGLDDLTGQTSMTG